MKQQYSAERCGRNGVAVIPDHGEEKKRRDKAAEKE
jgi:hypothetical protein